MRYIKLFEEYNGSYHEDWTKFLPESFTFIKGDETYTRYKTDNIMNHADMVQIMYEPKGENWGDPDDLQFDLYFSMNGSIRIDVDITFGDLMVSEFSIESPNKVDVIQYTSYGSKFDMSNTVFAFTEESLQSLIKFLNGVDSRLELTRDKFNFLDANPYSYQPN